MDNVQTLTFFFDFDDITGTQQIGRDIHNISVYHEMSVADKLPGGFARGRETQTVDDIVQTRFQENQEVLTGYTLLLGSLQVIVMELVFQKTINSFNFLFFTELNALVGNLPADIETMLPGRKVSSLYRAFFRVAARSF